MEAPSQPQSQALSPFLSIWVKPRQTIRRIVETDPDKDIFLLAALAGIGQALSRLSSRNAGDSWPIPAILTFGVIVGAISGVISMLIGGSLLRWSGSKLGGQASSTEVQAAIAWSSVPYIFISLLWIPELLIFGEELFTTLTPRLDANLLLGLLLLGFAFIEITGGIWTLVVFLQCLGEVHRFSAWKALGSVMIGLLVLLIPTLIIVCLFTGIPLLLRQ